jgi:hypothetical protein
VPEGNRVQDRIALTMFRIMARTPKRLLLFLELFVVFKCLLIVVVAPCFFCYDLCFTSRLICHLSLFHIEI